MVGHSLADSCLECDEMQFDLTTMSNLSNKNQLITERLPKQCGGQMLWTVILRVKRLGVGRGQKIGKSAVE